MADSPRMIFNAFVQIVPGHHYEGLWRSPWGLENPYEKFDTWIRMVKRIEEAKFDGLFIADSLGLYGTFGGNHRAHAEGGIAFPGDDAIILAAALAAVTENLSLGFTSTTIQNQPFEFARMASTLDRVSNGRAAWNIVASALLSAHQNVGMEQVPSNEERYARADEFLEVVFSLLEGSWDKNAILRDVEKGVFSDPSKIYRINHKSRNYSVAGPLLTEPSPQRTPFLYTAGMSKNSIRLAAQHAEAMLIQVRDREHAARIVGELDALLPEFGRRPGDVKVIQSLRFVVGSTEEEAKRNHDEIYSYINPRGTLVEAAGILGMDLSGYDLDEEVDISSAPGFKGLFGAASLGEGKTTATPRQIASFSDHPAVVGTPEYIADEIEKWRDAGVSGINLGDYMFHKAYEPFVEQVMPVLRQRGIAQSEYAPGTFREKVFAEGPHLPDRHPAATYRGAFTDAIG
jgi:FMN-dependent oxidoreductase (nitrilotriacetate monooxygenase family)